MTVWIKQGVFGRLSPIMRRCKGRLAALYKLKGLDFFITSKVEGNHMDASCHYEGDALDFKRQGISIDEIRETAGNGFDVYEYQNPVDIFHAEWDPKEGN